jgi:hypothetical protein
MPIGSSESGELEEGRRNVVRQRREVLLESCPRRWDAPPARPFFLVTCMVDHTRTVILSGGALERESRVCARAVSSLTECLAERRAFGRGG